MWPSDFNIVTSSQRRFAVLSCNNWAQFFLRYIPSHAWKHCMRSQHLMLRCLWSPSSRSSLSQIFLISDWCRSHVNSHLTDNIPSYSLDLSNIYSVFPAMKASETIICWDPACSSRTEADHIDRFCLRGSRTDSPVSWWSSISIIWAHRETPIFDRN